MASPVRVCIVGSGNWASVVGENVVGNKKFDETVKMWVFEEMIGCRKLSEIINTQHENVRYLPGYKLPENLGPESEVQGKIEALVQKMESLEEINGDGGTEKEGRDTGAITNVISTEQFGTSQQVAVPELLAAVEDADLLVIVVPHQFIGQTCDQLKGHVKPSAIGISLIKSVVAIAARLCDGLGCGVNMKAAVMRLGMMEVAAFAKLHCKSSVLYSTFLESCGPHRLLLWRLQQEDCGSLHSSWKELPRPSVWAVGLFVLLETKKVGLTEAVQFAVCSVAKSIEQLETEMLNGQKLQGLQTAVQLHHSLMLKNMVARFPLFTAVYQICYEGNPLPPGSS